MCFSIVSDQLFVPRCADFSSRCVAYHCWRILVGKVNLELNKHFLIPFFSWKLPHILHIEVKGMLKLNSEHVVVIYFNLLVFLNKMFHCEKCTLTQNLP